MLITFGSGRSRWTINPLECLIHWTFSTDDNHPSGASIYHNKADEPLFVNREDVRELHQKVMDWQRTLETREYGN